MLLALLSKCSGLPAHRAPFHRHPIQLSESASAVIQCQYRIGASLIKTAQLQDYFSKENLIMMILALLKYKQRSPTYKICITELDIKTPSYTHVIFRIQSLNTFILDQFSFTGSLYCAVNKTFQFHFYAWFLVSNSHLSSYLTFPFCVLPDQKHFSLLWLCKQRQKEH